MENQEVWRSLACCNLSNYEISSFGRLKTIQSGYITLGSTQGGYRSCNPPYDDGKTRKTYLHRLVAFAFLGPPPTVKHTVDHIDGNKSNNVPHNLRWASKSEQCFNRKNPEKYQGKGVLQFSENWVLIKRWDRIGDVQALEGSSRKLLKTAMKKASLLLGCYWRVDVDILEGETWWIIKPGIFKHELWVSDFGRFYRADRIAIGTLHPEGRMFAKFIMADGSRKSIFIHRLVMACFVGESDEDLQVNHIDGNGQNNRLDNLEYVTSQQNHQHAVNTGLRVMNTVNHPQGKAVHKLDDNGNILATYSSGRLAARECELSSGGISSACIKQVRCGDFYWRYVDGVGSYKHLE